MASRSRKMTGQDSTWSKVRYGLQGLRQSKLPFKSDLLHRQSASIESPSVPSFPRLPSSKAARYDSRQAAVQDHNTGQASIYGARTRVVDELRDFEEPHHNREPRPAKTLPTASYPLPRTTSTPRHVPLTRKPRTAAFTPSENEYAEYSASPHGHHKSVLPSQTFFEDDPEEAAYWNNHAQSTQLGHKRKHEAMIPLESKRTRQVALQRQAWNHEDEHHQTSRFQHHPQAQTPARPQLIIPHRTHPTPSHTDAPHRPATPYTPVQPVASHRFASQSRASVQRHPTSHPEQQMPKTTRNDLASSRRPTHALCRPVVGAVPDAPTKHPRPLTLNPVPQRVQKERLERSASGYASAVIAQPPPPVRTRFAPRPLPVPSPTTRTGSETPIGQPTPSARPRAVPQPFPMLGSTPTRRSDGDSDGAAPRTTSGQRAIDPSAEDADITAQIDETLEGISGADDIWDLSSEMASSDGDRGDDGEQAKMNIGATFPKLQPSLPSPGDEEDLDDALRRCLRATPALRAEWNDDEEEPVGTNTDKAPPPTSIRSDQRVARWVGAIQNDATEDAMSFFGDAFDTSTRTLRIPPDSRMSDLDLKIGALYESKDRITRYTGAINILALEDLPDYTTMISLADHCDAHQSQLLFPNVKHLVFAGSAQSRFVQIVLVRSADQVSSYLQAFARLCSPRTLCSDYSFGAQGSSTIAAGLQVLKTHWTALERCSIHKALDDLPWVMPGMEHRMIYHSSSFPFTWAMGNALARWDLGKVFKDDDPQSSWLVDIPPMGLTDKIVFAKWFKEVQDRLTLAQEKMPVRDVQGVDPSRSKDRFTVRMRKDDHVSCTDCGWTSAEVCKLVMGDQW